MISSDWLFLLFFFLAIFIVITLAEIFRRLMFWSSEATRKLVHIFVGALIATTPFFFQSKWPMVVLGVLFTLVDFVAVKQNMLQGMHGTKRQTYGTVYYPISFVLLVLLLWDNHKLILVISMLIMALSDACAAIVGENVKKPVLLKFGPESKSLQGSLTMFGATFIVVLLSLFLLPQLATKFYSPLIIAWTAIVVGVIATASEAVSKGGSDNLSVPLLSAFALFFMLNNSVPELSAFSWGMLLAVLVAIMSYKFKFLDAGGSVTTFLLATVVFGVGRWAFSLPILTFFILSSILSKMGKKRKKSFTLIFEKSSQRDLWQVLANGALAGMVVIFWYFYKVDWLYILYVGAIAAVTADTWGTEIGVLSKSKPRSILNFKSVSPGTSGGISLMGTFGALVGAFLIGVVALVGASLNIELSFGTSELVIVTVAGLMASLVDSLLGATVQAQFYCEKCQKNTEKQNHCGEAAQFNSGLLGVNNDFVNILCAASGILFSYLGFNLIF
jgi:uncharacterized protein (TIGR00297 family)